MTAERAREARNPATRQCSPPPGGFGGLNVQGLPISKPPYGILAAIDLDKGQLKWQTPHGDTPDQVRNHPALKGLNIPKTGQAQTSGVGLADHQDAGHHGRPGGDHDAGASARRHAARLRQGERAAGRRGVHAGAAERQSR